MDTNIIAELELDILDPNGIEKKRIDLKVCKPTFKSDGEWTCLFTDPVSQEVSSVSGNDSFQALNLAMNFIGSRMSFMLEKGFQFFYPDSEHEFLIGPYFFISEFHEQMKANGQNQAAQVNPCNPPENPRTT